MNSYPESTNPVLQSLLRRHLIHRGGTDLAQQIRPSGLPRLDDKLGGGFPDQGLIDVQSPRGIGELRLFLPSLTQAQAGSRLCVFIAPPLALHAEGLAAAGLDLARVLLVRPNSATASLWAAEQSLKSGACHAVVLWQNAMSFHQARRLQLAAQEGRSQLLLLRHSNASTLSSNPLPASLCLRLSAHAQGLIVGIPKRLGAWPVADFVLNLQSLWPELTLTPAPHRPLPLTGLQAI